MEQTEQSERTFLAKTPSFPGYWGRHKDGPHHAIAECCSAGAHRFGIFVVYEGPASMDCDPMLGGLRWDIDPDKPEAEQEPKLDGIYTASGIHLGDSLAEVAEDVRKRRIEPDEYGLDRETVSALKAHKPED